MSSFVDLGNCSFSYENPNYQVIRSDENCNVKVGKSLNNLYEELNLTCSVNRKIGTSGRRKYASLEPSSMGVNLDLETSPMLPSNKLKESFPGIDNGNSTFESNENKDFVKRSSFLDYYISLETAAQKKKPAFDSLCFLDLSTQKSSTDQDKHLDTFTFEDSLNSEYLPNGWEKHEDESGPYYWHISSGTIQRDPPLSHLQCNKITTLKSKDLVLVSNKQEGTFNTYKKFHGCNNPSGIFSACGQEDKIKRRSCPDKFSALNAEKRPIRFALRSLGWVEIAEEDLTPERSSKAVNKCIVDLSIGRNNILDVVGKWGDGKDLFMDLDDYSLCLMDTQDLTILNTQPIHTIRVWGVGRDNGRDFAYVARDPVTKKYMCHVFRCDIPARIIANTLRDICKKIMIERSLQRSLNKKSDLASSLKSINFHPDFQASTRPSNLLMDHFLHPFTDLKSSDAAQFFPTPMDEPKKVLKVYYLGSTNVEKATGIEVLNDAIEKLSKSISKSEYKYVNVAVAPSTITISEPGEEGKQITECRVRFLSFLAIGKNIKTCGFIVHTAQNDFVAHVFYCEPSSGALCKTIEAACKLRYQKCLDAHKQENDTNSSNSKKKNIKAAIKNVFGTFFSNPTTEKG